MSFVWSDPFKPQAEVRSPKFLSISRVLKDTKAQPQPIYTRGHIVYDKSDVDSRGEPTRKKLWVWEMKYDPTYESASSHRERKKALSYSMKDGPGEKAKDMGLVSEEDLRETEPEVENLIDFD